MIAASLQDDSETSRLVCVSLGRYVLLQKSTQDQVSHLSKQAIGAEHLKESGYAFDEAMKESEGKTRRWGQ